MRLFRCLALLLSLAAPAAFAGGPYQVELVVFRQAGDAVPSSQPAPDDWATGAQPLASDACAPPRSTTSSPSSARTTATPCCCTRPGARTSARPR